METLNCLEKRNGRILKAAQNTEEMTLGEVIVSFYDSWSEPRAGGMVRLALNAGIIVFSNSALKSPLTEKKH
ncbi:MAG: hypothetical protein P1V20_03540 [Verrucomicrobiales bacterium]|nr:hypothetical protein [Verrucomicrobiales bacterium]